MSVPQVTINSYEGPAQVHNAVPACTPRRPPVPERGAESYELE